MTTKSKTKATASKIIARNEKRSMPSGTVEVNKRPSRTKSHAAQKASVANDQKSVIMYFDKELTTGAATALLQTLHKQLEESQAARGKLLADGFSSNITHLIEAHLLRVKNSRQKHVIKWLSILAGALFGWNLGTLISMIMAGA